MRTEPKTRRGRQSRDRIVERAAGLIAERGIERTGLDDVLAAAGASKGQLYHYFAGRDGLVEAAVDHRCTQVQEALALMFGGLDSLTELKGQLDAFAGIYEQTLAGCPIGSLASEVAGRHRGAQQRVAAAFDTWQGHFADLFTRLRERGDLRAGADPAALATALLAALEGGQILSQARNDVTSLRVTIAAAFGYIRTFVE